MGNCCCLLLKNYVFWMVMTGIFCLAIDVGINIAFSILWNFIMEYIPSPYDNIKYLQILIHIVFNYLLIRKILLSFLFEWQFPFQIFSIYKERQGYVSFLKSRLNNFIKTIAKVEKNYKILSNLSKEDIGYFIALIEDEYNVYDKLYSKCISHNNNDVIRYKISNCQMQYYMLLKEIIRILNENNFKGKLISLKNSDFSNNNSNIIENDNDNIISTDTTNSNQVSELNFDNINFVYFNRLLTQFKNMLEKYDWENYTYMSPAYVYNLLFNDTFGSLSLYSIQYKLKFEEYESEENFTRNGKIHYCLVLNTKKKKNNDNEFDDSKVLLENTNETYGQNVLLIFCLPNGCIFELMPKIKVEFYLNNGISFLSWNYKGYGFSKGSPNFTNIKEDILELYDSVAMNPRYNFKKIIVMGHSIGGVPAIYLARNRKVDLLISDRNFCQIDRIIYNFTGGIVLNILYKLFVIGDTDNIPNLINSNINKDIYKIIIFSPLDNLILNDASCKSGLTRYIIKNYITYKNPENNQIISNKDNILDLIFSKNDKERLIRNLYELVHFYYDYSEEKIKMTEEKIYDDNPLPNNSKKIIDDEDVIINDKNKIPQNQSISMKKALYEFFDPFFGVCCDNLNLLSSMEDGQRIEFLFLDCFFNNLIIWGIQGGEDLNEEDDFEFEASRGILALRKANQALQNFEPKENEINENRIISIMVSLKNDIGKLVNGFDYFDINLQNNVVINNIKPKNDKDNDIKEDLIKNKNNEEEVEEEEEINTNTNASTEKQTKKSSNLSSHDKLFYDKLNSIKGNFKLFRTFAGHNGFLRNDERNQFYILLLSTGII